MNLNGQPFLWNSILLLQKSTSILGDHMLIWSSVSMILFYTIKIIKLCQLQVVAEKLWRILLKTLNNSNSFSKVKLNLFSNKLSKKKRNKKMKISRFNFWLRIKEKQKLHCLNQFFTKILNIMIKKSPRSW